MLWRHLLRILKIIALIILFGIFIAPEWPPFEDEEHQIHALVGLRQHDFLLWEIEAVVTKAKAVLGNSHTYLSGEERKQFVLDYLDLIRQIHQLERQINDIYIDPEIENPNEFSQPLQRKLAQQRDFLTQLKPLAEAIVQDQVAEVLVAEGFDISHQSWPPPFMHMSPLPSVLIVSPRDRIERLYQVTLKNGVPIAEQDEIETAVFKNLSLSALVVPIGGLGTYPAMIQEASNINWLIEVTAHEWAHNWFGFAPVSLQYGNDPVARKVNETAVSIIDQEIALSVITNHYPELLPPPTPPATEDNSPQPAPQPPTFDFREEMFQTRVGVDELLTEGHIEDAESYMEERRALFLANGYNIRKINQAYFAFYGAYAASPGGSAGEDPVGQMVRDIRANSASIREFLERIAPIGNFEDLEKAHFEAVSPTSN